MAIWKVPPGDAPVEIRVHQSVPYELWYVPEFRLDCLGGKLDKDPAERPWIMGLLADLRAAPRFKNPVIVWNHHPQRGVKQPYWLLRAGSNRVWCAEQLGWCTVPAIVSTLKGQPIPALGPQFWVQPTQVQSYFKDGGNVWVTDVGFGLLRAKKPEVTYSQYIPTSTELSELKPTAHHLDKIINPLLDD